MTNETYSVIGLGKLSASMAAAIAKRGFQVIGVDINQKAIDLVNAGRRTFFFNNNHIQINP